MALPNSIRKAALAGDIAALEKWFEQPCPDPDESDDHGWTLMHHVANRGHVAAMRVLADKGVSATRADADGWTPLHVASIHGHGDAAWLLLDRGARVDARTRRAATPLHLAAEQNHCGVLRVLLRRGAALDARDDAGRAAEARATGAARPEAAALLAAVRRAGDWKASGAGARSPAARAPRRPPRARQVRPRLPDAARRAPRPRGAGRARGAEKIRRVRDASSARPIAPPTGGERSVRDVRRSWNGAAASGTSSPAGRASTPDPLLARLFPWHAPVPRDDDATDEPPSLRAREATEPRDVPREVFWRVFAYWRCRDD